MKAFEGPLLSKGRLEVQTLEFQVTINQDYVANEIIYTKKSDFWLVLTPSTISR